MSENILDLIFHADTKELDEAKEKLAGLGNHLPTVGEAIEGLAEKFKNIPGPIGLATAAAVGFGIGLSKMIEGVIESETRLLELSEAMGVPVEKAQPFIEAMALSGIAGEKLQATMGKLAMAVGKALEDPTGKAADAFKKLGVSQKELADGDTEQIMKDAAKGLDQYADSANKTAVIRELFGKQGPAIVAAMKDEAEMEVKAADAQEQYGTKISETDAKSSKYFGETLKLGMTMFEGVAMSVTKSLLPGLQILVDQFAESGKEGGVMRDILDGLSATISVVSKAIITLLVEPIRFAAEVFKEAGTAIGATMAAIGLAATGHFGEAKKVMTDMNDDLNRMGADYSAAADKFENALWGTAKATDDWGNSNEEAKKKLTSFDAGAHKVSDTLEQLADKLVAQHTIWQAAGEGLEQYKKAQDDAAISAERLKIAKEGGSKQAQDEAEALMRAANADKQATAEEVAGWNIINRLATENIGLTTHQTELQKNLAEIAKNTGMSDEQKKVAKALAESNTQYKEEEQLKKELASLDGVVERGNQAQVASMTLGTNQLKLFNEQLKLRAAYEKALEKDPAHEKELTAAFERNKKALQDNNKETQAWTSSMAGFGAGSKQAFANFADGALNANKIGNQLVSQGLNGMATALSEIGTKGTQAFKDLASSMLKMIEQAAAKILIVEGIASAVTAIWGTGAGDAVWELAGGKPKGFANGGAFSGGVQAFADGGVVSQPTYFNMGLMGEAGPEAIMPLSRDSSGKLGVNVNGSSGSSPSEVHYHSPSITIHTNQDPHEVAKQVKKLNNLHDAKIRSVIASEKRVGGQLHNQAPMFAN